MLLLALVMTTCFIREGASLNYFIHWSRSEVFRCINGTGIYVKVINFFPTISKCMFDPHSCLKLFEFSSMFL